ncbi:uncharacterized protein LOC142163953 [Nicotiana tabacum]|uniref:Uncharacterized protein LOC142163953 n=1 Tax=Nicotiana tabacum TaxID=4097 RepID=A0AC58RWV1_TOBAC
MECYSPKLKITKVLWELPEPGWMNVNTDEASKGNPRRSSIGYVLRNEIGDVLYACGREIQDSTNTEAEAVAMVEALKHYVEHSYLQIWLQTDSLLLNNTVDGTWSSPWKVVGHVEEIRLLMESCEVEVSHIMRGE